MDDFQPLSDIWQNYNDSLSSAIDQGYIDDPDTAEHFVWPSDLKFGEGEQDDVQRYVHERMTEIVDRVKSDRGVDPNVIAGYIFRSVVVGMMWERERIGR